MRILGIAGSPRRNGNTHRLIQHVLAGAGEAGAQPDELFLGDHTIRPCDGCHACWLGDTCAKNDDMIGLFARIAVSDVLVFGTPVYWYGPTALMKGFIDRFVYFNCPEHRPMIRGKSAAVVIPFEEDALETAELLLTFFARCFDYLEIRPAGRLVVPGVTRRGEVIEQPGRLEEARLLGRALVGAGRG